MLSRYRVVTAAVLLAASLGFSGPRSVCLDADPFISLYMGAFGADWAAGEAGEPIQRLTLYLTDKVVDAGLALRNKTEDSSEVADLSALDAAQIQRLVQLNSAGKLRIENKTDSLLVRMAILMMESRLLRLGLWREQVKIGD